MDVFHGKMDDDSQFCHFTESGKRINRNKCYQVVAQVSVQMVAILKDEWKPQINESVQYIQTGESGEDTTTDGSNLIVVEIPAIECEFVSAITSTMKYMDSQFNKADKISECPARNRCDLIVVQVSVFNWSVIRHVSTERLIRLQFSKAAKPSKSATLDWGNLVKVQEPEH